MRTPTHHTKNCVCFVYILKTQPHSRDGINRPPIPARPGEMLRAWKKTQLLPPWGGRTLSMTPEIPRGQISAWTTLNPQHNPLVIFCCPLFRKEEMKEDREGGREAILHRMGLPLAFPKDESSKKHTTCNPEDWRAFSRKPLLGTTPATGLPIALQTSSRYALTKSFAFGPSA